MPAPHIKKLSGMVGLASFELATAGLGNAARSSALFAWLELQVNRGIQTALIPGSLA
jgi:hypothetical protein